LHADPRLAGNVRELEDLFSDVYIQKLAIKPMQADQVAAENWYRMSTEISRAARGEPGAPERLRQLATERTAP
jgi:hypothetical protein